MASTNGLSAEDFAGAVELHRAGRLEEAAALYRAFSSAPTPFAADALINLGVILDDNGEHGEAVRHYHAALSLRPHDPLALNNMGNSLTKLGRFADAVACLGEAVTHAPGCQQARVALGAALQREGDAAGAIACFREALRRDPADAEAHWNLALALLISGEFTEGWREYEWRWRRDTFTSPRRGFAQPLWDGLPLDGRRILVHAEQGFGDTIQFMRYLPMVAAAGGVVAAECQSPSLRPLLQGIPGVSSVHVMGDPLPPFDLQVPLLSLPRIFGTTVDNVPNRTPYLAPDPERVAAWKTRVVDPEAYKVGIVWAGKALPDPFRSCTLEKLAPLGRIPALALYSLQVGAGSAADAPAGLDVIDLTAGITDFADTAALVSLLDLVISVDTSVAHLAGALGKPVWLMLPKAGDYRWLIKREDSPWYPSMRIFRQQTQGEWEPVIERIAGELGDACRQFLEAGAAADPFDGGRHYRLGEILAAEGRHAEAALRFSKAAQLLPSRWEPQYCAAASLQQVGLIAEARQSLEGAITIAADVALLHEALGIVTQMEGDVERAAACYEKALALDAGLVKSRYNRATVHREMGMFREALTGFEEVVRLAPGHADAHWNLAVLLLMTGDLRAGWREFHWRYRKSEAAPVQRWQDHPLWDGGRLDGKTILLHAEEGLGDTLQFIRYAPLVAQRGAEVVVEVQSPALVSIVSRVDGVAKVLVAGEAPPRFDVQAPLLALPGIFETDLASVPAQVPYLQRDPVLVDPARKLVPQDGTFRIGIVWCGNPMHNNDARRSIPFEKLAPLADFPGVTFYSLQLRNRASVPSPLAGEGQGGGGVAVIDSVGNADFPHLLSPSREGRGDASVEEPGSAGRFEVTDLSHAIGDFSDTAALAGELDLILTVDTSVAHLCGGLGLPVWMMIPFVPDWRWLLERDDSPWYPTMRIFRQKAAGDWDGVIARVRYEFMARVEKERRGSGQAPAEPVPSQRHRDAALALSGQGRFLEAARELEAALRLAPHDVEVMNDLGCALDNGGRHAEAAAVYAEAVAVSPDFMPAHYNLGNSLKALGRTQEAVDCYRRALSLDPLLPQGWHNLALSLQELGELDEAKHALERAVSLHPDYLEARHNLGELHHRRGEPEAALQCFIGVLGRNPQYLPSWNALGIALQTQDRLDEAAACYEKALSIDPGYLHALNNLGAASKALGNLHRAVDCYLKVLALDPDYADARWNLALVHLLQGRFEEGWRGYEWRFRKVDPVLQRTLPQPLWDGSPIGGKTILLHAEQGFGDAIQFVRYATILAGRGATVLVECQSRAIAPVVATVPGVARAFVRGDQLPHFDCHAPLMSLPLLCKTTLATIPAGIPYVSADPAAVAQWRERLDGRGLKVGLVWAGRKTYKDDAKRSLNLQMFAPLAGVARARLYSLQIGEGAEQTAAPPAGMQITELGGFIQSFADTAAIIENLDLVVSADTAVAHLAGALGKKVWVLLPMVCDWRWLLDRDDSPWYPTARLFRQRRRGDWSEVLERVAHQLAQETAGRCSVPLRPVLPSGPFVG